MFGRDKKAARDADDRYDAVLKYHRELTEFIANVQQCADKGPPPTDNKCPEREVDARYDPDLDDGVMINSAALWPLLEPQWKDPKKWWKQLALANPERATRITIGRIWRCVTSPSVSIRNAKPIRHWAWPTGVSGNTTPNGLGPGNCDCRMKSHRTFASKRLRTAAMAGIPGTSRGVFA